MIYDGIPPLMVTWDYRFSIRLETTYLVETKNFLLKVL